MLMETAIRFEVEDGEWVSSKSVEQSVPQRIPFSIQLLPFEESLAQSDDVLLHSLDTSMSSIRSRILDTPSCSKKKKETSFEEIWSALKPRSPGFNYFPKNAENSTPETEIKNASNRELVSTSRTIPKHELVSTSETIPKHELLSTSEIVPKHELVPKPEDIRRSDVPKSSSLFASAKGETVTLSDRATSRARTLLLEEVDGLPPIKRKAETTVGGFSKKPATAFKVPFRGFKPPFRKTMVDVEPPNLTPGTSISDPDSGELRRATITGPPAPQKSSWRPLDANLRPKEDSFSQMTIPESPLSELTDLHSDSSSAILPSVSQRFVFADGTNSRRLQEQMIERGLNVSLPWIDQHYRWIIWTLSGLSPDHQKTLFNPETTLQELEHRYYTESKQKNGVSCLQELVKKEGWSSDQMVLLIADIQSTGGNKTQSMRLELSDRWTSVFIEVDRALQSKMNSNRIRIGSFLAIHHLQIIKRRTDQPITLQLKHNHCTTVPEGTKLGIHEDEQFFVPLCWIDGNGGSISRTWVCICRKYPLTFKHKSPDGRYSDLTVTQHEHKMKVFNQQIEELRTKATADVKKKQFEFFSQVVESKEAGEEVDEMEWLFAMHLLEQEVDQSLLTNDALRDLEQFRQVHKESIARCVESTVNRLIREQGVFAPSGDPHIDLLVSEVCRSGTQGGMNAQLTFWMRDLEDEVEFKEGDVFEFRELSVGRYPASNGLMSLRSTRETTYRRVCHLEDLSDGLSVSYSPTTPVQDLSSLSNGDLFDFVAFVVQDSNGECLICRSAEVPESKQSMIKICLLENDPLDKTKAGDVLLLKDLAFGSFSNSENLTLAFVTQRTNSALIKGHRNREILLQLLN